MNKIVCMILVFVFCTKTIYASEMPVMSFRNDNVKYEVIDNILDDSNENVRIGFAIPVAHAFGYLMGALGVVGGSVAIYENADTITEFFNGQIEKFKVKAVALGIGAEIVDRWLEDLASGVLTKSSEVWTAFKEWVRDLRSGVVSSVPGELANGLIEPGKFYDVSSALPVYSSFTFTANLPGYAFVTLSNGRPNNFIVAFHHSEPTYANGFYTYTRVKADGTVTNKTATSMANKVYIGDKYYYYSAFNVLGMEMDDSFYSTLPFINGHTSLALEMLINGEYTPPVVSSDYTIIGNINSIDKVGIRNPGLDETQDVSIDWGNFDTVEVITGVGTGAITWDEALSQGNLVVTEDDIVIGGVDEVVPPIEVPDTDWSWWSWLKDWITSFFDMLGTLLKSLFIPDANFFNNWFTNLKNLFSNKLGFADYISFFEDLKSVVASSPDYGGFINTDMWLPYLDKIHSYIRGFIYALMVIFNIKMIIWMVRGSTFITDGKGNVVGGSSLWY